MSRLIANDRYAYSDFEILLTYVRANIPKVNSKNAPAITKRLNAFSIAITSFKVASLPPSP
jgi:hypothetical protein